MYQLKLKELGLFGVFSTTLCFAAASGAGELKSPVNSAINPAFDIVDSHAHSHESEGLVTFMMETEGAVGTVKPKETGQLLGAGVESYVWPTSLDPSVAGFDKESGILALAITAHPDFDDTPLFDENADGDLKNDGSGWHSHWVVLVEHKECAGGLAVRDVSPGVDALPNTAPRLPIALDSPGMSPILSGNTASLTVPVRNRDELKFDGVTARLRVNEKGATPLLCVETVHDIASGDLSLPGRLTPAMK
jgi:hypothetical protein